MEVNIKEWPHYELEDDTYEKTTEMGMHIWMQM